MSEYEQRMCSLVVLLRLIIVTIIIWTTSKSFDIDDSARHLSVSTTSYSCSAHFWKAFWKEDAFCEKEAPIQVFFKSLVNTIWKVATDWCQLVGSLASFRINLVSSSIALPLPISIHLSASHYRTDYLLLVKKCTALKVTLGNVYTHNWWPLFLPESFTRVLVAERRDGKNTLLWIFLQYAYFAAKVTGRGLVSCESAVQIKLRQLLPPLLLTTHTAY